MTVAKSSRFAETGVQLGNAKQREDLAKKIDDAPPAKRRELVRDLKRTLQNLAELLKLVDNDGEDEK